MNGLRASFAQLVTVMAAAGGQVMCASADAAAAEIPQLIEVIGGPGGSYDIILPPPLEITAAVNQQAYLPGEYIGFGVTVHNPRDSDVTLDFNSSLQCKYYLDGEEGFWAAVAYPSRRTIPANGSYTWHPGPSYRHHDITSGRHMLTGEVLGVGMSQPVEFEVLPRPAWPEEFLIDFDSEDAPLAPYAGAIPTWRGFGVFDGMGVQFARWLSNDRKESLYHYCGADGQGSLRSNRCSYPPGFNIVADFDEPVFGVSVDVTTAAGRTVTMLAKDADGHVVASATSGTLPGTYDFAETLRLISADPITSIEWWPSEENCSVGIDNLDIVTVPGREPLPEPSTAALLSVLAVASLRRRRKA